MLVKKPVVKKRRPRYAVVAKQPIRREAGANAELVGVERDPRTWVNEGDEIAMMSKTKVDGTVWVQFRSGWLAVRDPKTGKELLKSRKSKPS